MLTVLFLLALAAFITAVVGAMGKCPWWVPVIFLCIIELLQHLPHG